jgi:hypothetical protein
MRAATGARHHEGLGNSTVRLTLQQLEAHLWGAANILRGKTAGQDYKNYILSLMFYKRLCDQWECEADDAIAELERSGAPKHAPRIPPHSGRGPRTEEIHPSARRLRPLSRATPRRMTPFEAEPGTVQ